MVKLIIVNWKGYEVYQVEGVPGNLVLLNPENESTAIFKAGNRSWKTQDELMALVEADLKAGRLEWD